MIARNDTVGRTGLRDVCFDSLFAGFINHTSLVCLVIIKVILK